MRLSRLVAILSLFHSFNILQPCSHLARAALVNVTVDDAGADPVTGSNITYAPANAWNANIGQACPWCPAQPDPAHAFMHTWHDGTFKPDVYPNIALNATFQFEGSALWVYCILAPSQQGLASDTDMSFFIDGQFVGSFVQMPTRVWDYTFNVLVYQNTTMPYGMHTFVLQNGRARDQEGALAILDYLTYAHEVNSTTLASSGFPSTPTSSTSGTSYSSLPSQSAPSGASQNLAIIIASVVGGVVILAAIILGVFFCRRKRSRKFHYNAYYDPPRPITAAMRDMIEEPIDKSDHITYGPSSIEHGQPDYATTYAPSSMEHGQSDYITTYAPSSMEEHSQSARQVAWNLAAPLNTHDNFVSQLPGTHRHSDMRPYES